MKPQNSKVVSILGFIFGQEFDTLKRKRKMV
jgi:hypothetical protein